MDGAFSAVPTLNDVGRRGAVLRFLVCMILFEGLVTGKLHRTKVDATYATNMPGSISTASPRSELTGHNSPPWRSSGLAYAIQQLTAYYLRRARLVLAGSSRPLLS